MTGQNIFMLSLSAFVLLAIGYFAVVQKSPHAVLDQLRSSFSSSRSVASRAEEEPAPIKANTPTRQPVRSGRNHTDPVEVVTVAPPVETPRVAVEAIRPHPSASEIRPGMQRSELLARFPDPAIQTRTIKDGDMIELIAYQRQDQGRATFAQLQNGVVTRVYSGLQTSSFPRQLNP